VCSYIATRCTRKSIAKALDVVKLLVLAKLFDGIRSITISKVFYWLVSKTLCFQYHNAFVIHLSSHQLGVTVMGGYETMVHSIQTALNVHPN
jgi:hypothetical protein